MAAIRPAAAQWWDPDRCVTCRDKREHFVAGVGLDLLARGPWLAPSFRDRPWKRVALTGVVATSWEIIEAAQARRDGKAGSGYGVSPLDIAATIAGAATLEAVTVVAHKLRRRR